MHPLKEYFNKEFYRLMHLRNMSDLPILYFRIFQILSILIFFSLSLSLLSALGWSAFGLLLSALVSLALNVAAAEVGFRATSHHQPMVVGIGLMLSVSHLFGIQFLLSVFGFYAFLNPASQRRYLRWAPPWVKDILSKLKMNWTD